MTTDTLISADEFVDMRGHKGPERRCVATGEVHDKSEMIRFVLGPDKSLVPDIAGKLPGRGVYVTASRSALETAIKSGGFKRSLKSDVKLNADLIDMTETLLKRRVLSLLTMALKGSRVYLGFDQVRAAAQSERLAWRIEARDGAEGGRGKIRVLTKAISHELERRPTPVIGCFNAAELGGAFGRETTVHAAVKSGPLGKSLSVAARRLSGFTELVPDEWADREHEDTNFFVKRTGDKG